MAYLGDNGLSKLWVRMKSYINNRIETLEQGVQMDLLWTNASPTSSFTAQSITVNGLSNYDEYEIVFRFHTSLTYENKDCSRVGNGTMLNVNDGTNVYVRTVTVSGNTLTFGAGKKMPISATSATTDNGYMIPVAIYGIKGVN